MTRFTPDSSNPSGNPFDGWIESASMITALGRKGLSKREAEVLTWVARGKTNSEIGVILQISPRTVSKHLERIYCKLGVECRSAAVVQLLEICQDDQLSRMQPEPFPGVNTDKKLVLLIDDDSILHKAIRSLLESEKYLCQDVEHESAVLAWLKADHADAVLSDNQMHILGGIPPPVAAPSSKLSEDVKDNAFKACAHTVLKKHSNFSELLLVVAQAIEFSINTQIFKNTGNTSNSK